MIRRLCDTHLESILRLKIWGECTFWIDILSPPQAAVYKYGHFVQIQIQIQIVMDTLSKSRPAVFNHKQRNIDLNQFLLFWIKSSRTLTKMIVFVHYQLGFSQTNRISNVNCLGWKELSFSLDWILYINFCSNFSLHFVIMIQKYHASPTPTQGRKTRATWNL